jgi:hypothetical protein
MAPLGYYLQGNLLHAADKETEALEVSLAKPGLRDRPSRLFRNAVSGMLFKAGSRPPP